MKKRIFRSVFLTSAAACVLSLLIAGFLMYGYFLNIERENLMSFAKVNSHGVEESGREWFVGLETRDYRVTWVSSDGKVIYDTYADADKMDNHGNRAEIVRAFENGAGESERYSDTLMKTTLYAAVRLTDGGAVRASLELDSILRLALNSAIPFAGAFALITALALAAAKRISRGVVDPLNKLDLEHTLENDSYDELAPLLTRIERQRRRIDEQTDALKRRREEFEAVTRGMSEGLVLINDANCVLSYNPAAQRLFSATDDCLGSSILSLDRSPEMRALIESANGGEAASAVTERNGRAWRLSVSPISANGKSAGACLIAIDITDSANAEQMRREFTSNVSHELKTPLQTILGAADLIENGIAKPEDIAGFAHKISAEARRLVALIDDIIRLSQLDERRGFPQEDVDLLAIAREAASAVDAEAQKRNVAVSVSGDGATIRGVRQLIYEIAYNLADNAVKYNRDGGSVKISVSGKNNSATLAVADTGAGISPEHQQRVFERFYRVDKSHSRLTGGTGLGLSIVKRAAAYHSARIEMTSELGKGTCVTVRFG